MEFEILIELTKNTIKVHMVEAEGPPLNSEGLLVVVFVLCFQSRLR